jgi:hypothetical protein
LKSIAQGYDEDLTRKINMVPYAYLIFLSEKKIGEPARTDKGEKVWTQGLEWSYAQKG